MTDDPFQSYADMAEEGEAYERALVTWMIDHGRNSKHPWPEHLIDLKERRLAWCRKVVELCKRAEQRQRSAA